jgi:hypothetical protein
MSKDRSNNQPLFRIDVERALEALLLAKAKKPKSTKTLVPYCFDLSNALDGLELYDLSKGASEFVELFGDPKHSQPAYDLLNYFVPLVEAFLTEEPEVDMATIQVLEPQFYEALHQIKPSEFSRAMLQSTDSLSQTTQLLEEPVMRREEIWASETTEQTELDQQLETILVAHDQPEPIQLIEEPVLAANDSEPQQEMAAVPAVDLSVISREIAENHEEANEETQDSKPEQLRASGFYPDDLAQSLEDSISRLDEMLGASQLEQQREQQREQLRVQQQEQERKDIEDSDAEPFFIDFSSSSLHGKSITSPPASLDFEKGILENSPVSKTVDLNTDNPDQTTRQEAQQNMQQKLQPLAEQVLDAKESSLPGTVEEASAQEDDDFAQPRAWVQVETKPNQLSAQALPVENENSTDSLDEHIQEQEDALGDDPLMELSKLTEQFSLAAQSIHEPAAQETKISEADLVEEISKDSQAMALNPLRPNSSLEEGAEEPQPMIDGVSIADLQRQRLNDTSDKPAIQPEKAPPVPVSQTTDTLQAESILATSAQSTPVVKAEEEKTQTEKAQPLLDSSMQTWAVPMSSASHSTSVGASHVFNEQGNEPNDHPVQRANPSRVSLSGLLESFSPQESLNQIQEARAILSRQRGWQVGQVDNILADQQDRLVRYGQISLAKAFRGLAEEVTIQDVFADANIIQRLLSVLSYLPVQAHISAAEQNLVIFIDLEGTFPTEGQLHLASNALTTIFGNIEVKPEFTRITCPSSLLRMPMLCYERDQDWFAVPVSQLVEAHQFGHEEAALESTLWDTHGSIEGPHHQIRLRCGSRDYTIYCHETLGTHTLNLFEKTPSALIKPVWFSGLAIDGHNQIYHCVSFDRYVEGV